MRHAKFKYLLLFLLPAACDAQATPDYQGEPLMVLTGTLESQLPGPLPAADLVIAWWPGSNAADGSALPPTYVQVQVATELPAHFSAQIFQPPPDSSYVVQPYSMGYTYLGPRFASANLLLVRHGVTITDPSINWVNPDQNQVIADFTSQYSLVYYESDGYPGVRDPDGVEHLGDHVTKGFHLIRHDTTTCSDHIPDPACLDFYMMVYGTISDDNRKACINSSQSTPNDTEVPIDAPIDLIVPGPPPAPADLPLCSPPPG